VTDDRARQASEEQLERLLRGLLEDEQGGAAGGVAEAAVPGEILEMREMAQRVRAASQWMPLPEGRVAVRRALVATAQQQQEQVRGGRGRTAWRWWQPRGVGILAGAAATLVLVFGLGAGMLDGLVMPSSPLYGVRLQLDEVRVWLVPTPAGKAELLLRAAEDRLAEIDAMVASEDVEGMKRAARALDSDVKRLHEVVATLPPAQRHRFEAALGVGDQ